MNLKTYYTNVDNSLMSKMDELRIKITDQNYNIICVTEIKPKIGNIPEKTPLDIPGYDFVVNSEYRNPETRGVGIYTKTNLQSEQIENETTELFADSVWISIGGKNADYKLLVGCIYRSGTPEKAVTLDKNMHEMINTMALNNKFSQVVIAGDFNHPDITWYPYPSTPHNFSRINTDHQFIDLSKTPS